MDILTHVFWIVLYIFVISFVPALVVFLASFLTGLGFPYQGRQIRHRQGVEKEGS